MQASALKLQAYSRMYFLRKQYKAARSATMLMQSSWRAREQRLAYAKVLHDYKAAVAIQRHYKGYAARKEYQKVRGPLVHPAAWDALLACVRWVAGASFETLKTLHRSASSACLATS